MKIRMLVCQAGADFVRNPGDLVNLPEVEAMRYIEAGIAAPVREEKREQAVATPRVEKAVK